VLKPVSNWERHFMNKEAEKPEPLSGMMKLYKGKLLKCRKTDRVYIVVDALLGHEPIRLLTGEASGQVKGIVLQTIINPDELAHFHELAREVPQPKIAKA